MNKANVSDAPKPALPYLLDKTAIAPSGPPEPVTPPGLTAEERVAASRAALRQTLMPPLAAPARKSSIVSKMKNAALQLPLVHMLVDGARSKWKDHPLHDAATAVGQASQLLARPLARKFPVQLIASAVAVGAVLLALKPWRLLLRRRVLLGTASFLVIPLVKRGLLDWGKRALALSSRRA